MATAYAATTCQQLCINVLIDQFFVKELKYFQKTNSCG